MKASRQRTLLIAAFTALNVAALGGVATVHVMQDGKKDAKIVRLTKRLDTCTAREDQIKRMVKRLDSCKDPKLLRSGCFEKEKRLMLEQSAEMYEKSGEFKQAGLLYVELGRLRDASRMISRCEKEEVPGVAEIKKALKERAEAFERFSRK